MTVKEFIETHPEASLTMMTPGGYVQLTPEAGRRLLNGEPVIAHPGMSGSFRSVDPEELLPQRVVDYAAIGPHAYGMMTYRDDMDFSKTREEDGCIIQTDKEAAPALVQDWEPEL